MIKVKHILDSVELDDGKRIWVEPMGLTRDLRNWCRVQQVMSHLGPPMELWRWFEEHPDGYEFFRGRYHEHLAGGPHRELLEKIAIASARENITLLHQGTDPQYNTGVALYEFLSDLSAYCPPEL